MELKIDLNHESCIDKALEKQKDQIIRKNKVQG